MAKKKQAEQQEQERIIPLQYAEIYRDIKGLCEYIRKMNKSADEVCPICMNVLDVLEGIIFDITTPAIRIGKGYAVLNKEAEYLDDCIDHREKLIAFEEYFNSDGEED